MDTQSDCIFQQPWWLDAVAPGRWGEVAVVKGGIIRARMPYVMERGPLGLRLMKLPPLTQVLGPSLAIADSKYAQRLSQEAELIDALLDQLPRFDLFWQHFHYSITNWLPLYWRGFQQTTRYTYLIDDLSDPDRIWEEFSSATRRHIRKAEKQVAVRVGDDIGRFIDVNSLTFRRQGMKVPYGAEVVRRVNEACRARDARRIFFAEDARGRVHAALFLVWDPNSAFLLMSGADPALRASGATSLLVWEAIKFAATVTGRFDFEGSMIQPIERFNRGFGARQVPYFHVTAMSPRLRFLVNVRDAGRSIRDMARRRTARPKHR